MRPGKKKDFRVQQGGDVLKDHANMELLEAREKERANSNAMYRRVRMSKWA